MAHNDDHQEDSGTPKATATGRGAELADLATLGELAVMVASFVATAAAGGVIGNKASSLLDNFRRRHGRSRDQELEEAVFRALRQVKRKPGVADSDLRLRARALLRAHKG